MKTETVESPRSVVVKVDPFNPPDDPGDLVERITVVKRLSFAQPPVWEPAEIHWKQGSVMPPDRAQAFAEALSWAVVKAWELDALKAADGAEA